MMTVEFCDFVFSAVSPCITDDNNCHRLHGECTDIGPNAFTCHCKQGFVGDGIQCTGKV